MAFKNPWGKGSSEFDKWFANIWDGNDDPLKAWGGTLKKRVPEVEEEDKPLEIVKSGPYPSGKKSDPALLAFDWKGTAEKLNNAINWEMGSGEWVGEGPEPFEKGPSITTTTNYLTEFIFPTAESINKWNNQLDEATEKVAKGTSVGTGVATMRLNPWVGLAISTFGDSLVSRLLTPVDVKLNPGDKVTIKSEFETIRSTQNYENSIDISMYMDVVGTNPKNIKTVYQRIPLDPNNVDEDNAVMKLYEQNIPSITTITNPNYSLAMPALRLVRTN